MADDELTDPESADRPTTLRDADVTDVLPADLDLDELDHAEYVFPNNNRRRIPGLLYIVIGLAVAACCLLVGSEDSILLTSTLLVASLGLVAFGVFHAIAGWNLSHDERDALVAANREVGFPVGHASAQMGWRGLLSRPTWRILLYSNEPQPLNRSMVLVDGTSGEVLESIVEDNPEDWSALRP